MLLNKKDKNKKYIVKDLVSDINEPEKEFMKSNIIEAAETNINSDEKYKWVDSQYGIRRYYKNKFISWNIWNINSLKKKGWFLWENGADFSAYRKCFRGVC